MGMRVGLAGNMNNNLYGLGLALEHHSDYEPLLLIGENEPHINHPENDHEVGWHRPPWIQTVTRTESRLLRYYPSRSKSLDTLNRCELAVLSGEYVSLAPFIKAPTVFFATGADLTAFPFRETYPVAPSGYVREKLTNRVMRQAHIRNHTRGIQAATVISAAAFGPFRNSLALLGVSEEDARLLTPAFPIPVSAQLFRPRNADEVSEAGKTLRDCGDFLIFLPSRLISSATRSRLDTGSWKNPEALIVGVSMFLDRLPRDRRAGVRLVVIDRAHSPDRQLVQRRLVNSPIGSHVTWISSDSVNGFSRLEMASLYSAVDVVADDFGAGWYGSVAVEALLSERPVITYVDPYVMDKEYSGSPFLNSRTGPEISSVLFEMWADPDLRSAVGRAGRSWAESHHGLEAAGHSFGRLTSKVESQFGNQPDIIEG